MNLEKSLEIFNVSDLTVETDETIKKKYKKLMIKYHPDNCNGNDAIAKDVSLAYDVLKEAIENIRKQLAINAVKEEYTIIIPLSKLIQVYDGKNITMSSGEKAKEVNRKDIQRYNTLIISDVTLNHNGIEHRFSNIQHWSISDKYVINCEILVNNLFDREKVLIKLEDFEKEISFTSQAVSMLIQLPFNISVEVKIDKKMKQDSTKKEKNE